VLNFKPVPFSSLLIIGTLLIPIQTSTEEYIFRGYLMQGWEFRNTNGSLLMTSIIFGSVHFGNPEVSKLGILCLCII
jgi:membrane protease YdiL (CAAX protease family)